MACKNCGNTKCNKLDCGCKDTYLTTPAPCPTPEDCPEAQPCAYITDSLCVRYTADDIICNEEIVVESNDSVQLALQKIVDFFCKCYDLDLSCLNILSDEKIYVFGQLDTNPINGTGFPNETLYNDKPYYTITNDVTGVIIGYIAWSDNNRWEIYPDWDIVLNEPVCSEIVCCNPGEGLYYSETESVQSNVWVNVCDSPFSIDRTLLGSVVDIDEITCASEQEAYSYLEQGICIIVDKISDIQLDWSCVKDYEEEAQTFNLLQEAFESIQDVICFLDNKIESIPDYNVVGGTDISVVSDFNPGTNTNTFTVNYDPDITYVQLAQYPSSGPMATWSDPDNTGTIVYQALQTQAVAPGVYEIEASIVAAYYDGYSAVALNVGTWDGVTFTPASNFAFHSATRDPISTPTKWRTINLHIPDLTVTAGQSIAFSIASNNPNDPATLTVFGQRCKILKIG